MQLLFVFLVVSSASALSGLRHKAEQEMLQVHESLAERPDGCAAINLNDLNTCKFYAVDDVAGLIKGSNEAYSGHTMDYIACDSNINTDQCPASTAVLNNANCAFRQEWAKQSWNAGFVVIKDGGVNKYFASNKPFDFCKCKGSRVENSFGRLQCRP